MNDPDVVLERFHKLTFTSPYKWSFYNYFQPYPDGSPTDEPYVYSTLVVNGNLALLINYTDTIYGSFSYYNIDYISDTEMIISGTETNNVNGQSVIRYVEYGYEKL